MMKFIELWDPALTGVGLAQQENDNQNFRELARLKGLQFRDPGKSIPDPSILLGIQIFPQELAALDSALECLSVPICLIQLVNLTVCRGGAEFDRYAPGIGTVPNSPVIAVWNGGRWTDIVFGNKATSLLRTGMVGLSLSIPEGG
jgi:hypothetical protein